MTDIHDRLLAKLVRLPTDYSVYGGTVHRWAGGDDYPDCSWDCRHAGWLKGDLGNDWCVCLNPKGPRFGLLTFEHQTGRGCYEPPVGNGGTSC